MAEDTVDEESKLELQRRELVETIASREVELQKMKTLLLEVQNRQMQAAIKRRSAE